jgi:hypothetical protein
MAAPAVFEPEHYVCQLLTPDGYIEASEPGGKWPADLRFSDAVLLPLDVKQGGRTRITAVGVFRYSDRRPRTQATWEDMVTLRERLLPRERRPMAIEVLVDGRPAGELRPTRAEEQEVPIDMPPGGRKPALVREEVVLTISGEVDLPAGRNDLLLVPRNIVDGRMDKVGVGAEPTAAENAK